MNQDRSITPATVALVVIGLVLVSLIPGEWSASPKRRVISTPVPTTTKVAFISGPLAFQPTPSPILPATSRTGGSPLAAELNAPGFDAQHDVATLHEILRQYLRLLHGRQGRPIGNDSDLARVLTGDNPMKLVVLPPTHTALSPDGRLRDRWGTPYFIHPRGRLAFEVRSAGPDRKLFTADDLIENPAPRQTDDGALSAIEEANEQ